MRIDYANIATKIALGFLLASCGGGGGGSGTTGGGFVSDTTPDAYTFVDQDNAVVSRFALSEPITITGINEAAAVSITGGEYSIDGGEFVSASGLVTNGARIVVRQTAADGFLQTTDATLTVGGVSDTFSVTTGPEDITPDWFGFESQFGVELSSSVQSEVVTITGINGAIAVQVTGGEYSVDGGDFTTDAGTIENDQTLVVRQQSADQSNTLTVTTIAVGDFSTQLFVETGRFYVSPGDYEALASCAPYVGSAQAPIKLVFLNIGDSSRFDAIVDDATNNQFSAIPPFSDYFSSLGFYKLDLGDGSNYDCVGTGTDTSDLGFQCNSQLVNEEIARQCDAGDANGFIKIAIAESQYSAKAADIIWMADNQRSYENTVIHEVGHNFGLADLYGGGYRFDGEPVVGWPPEISRRWLNLDGPGCPSWCDSARTPAEYNQSLSSACLTFTTKEECLAFNRPASDDCVDSDGDSLEDCCSWSETPSDDYFNSNCAPVWGAEDIGLSCLAGSGCYFGGAYGNNSWRPVKGHDDSLMYGLSATGFDTVSAAALTEALECCTDARDGDTSCAEFRLTFSDLLIDTIIEKRRLGSCGVY